MGQIEQIAPGVTRQFLYEGQIVAFTLTDGSRDTIDNWVAVITKMAENAPTDGPLFMLYDISQIYMSPYAREQLQDLAQNPPNVARLYLAVVVDSLVVQMLAVVFSRVPVPNMERKVFRDRDTASQWLKEKLEK